MRFIDLDDLYPLIAHLIPELEEAQLAVNSEPDPVSRSKLIEKHRTRWVALREAMDKLSYGKCWYIECRNPGTDDDVDHFRPKGKLSDDDVDHSGYYWLAFNWQNFRLSCHRANRPRINPEDHVTGGKAAHFPLLNPADRAYSPLDSLDREIPGLFDPCDLEDYLKLTFLPSGEVDLSPEFKGDSVLEEKLAYSKWILNLNWPTFKEERVDLYGKISRFVREAQKQAPATPTDSWRGSFKFCVKELVRMMKPQEEYSRAARAYVELFQDLWWVKDIVLRVAS